MAKRASEMGVSNTMRFFKKEFSDRPLKESTVRTWKDKYELELKLRHKLGKPMEVKKLESAKRGHPLLLGPKLDKEAQEYVTNLREASAVINSAIVMAAAEGIVKNFDSNLLQCNGGHIVITKSWAKSFLDRMGYVKRRASTKSKVNPIDFEAHKEQFVFDVKTIVQMEEIPKALIINWDHTGIHYVPVSSWTMAKEGEKRIEIAGVHDKRQITAVFANTMDGDFLPPQIIYSWKTKKCLPSVEFPEDWHITYTQNHWANEATTEDYIMKILVPYAVKKRSELCLPVDQPVLVIFDRFKAQCTEKILALLDNHHIRVAIVPPNCTDRLQPLDISVNKAAKEFLRRQFQQWYSDQIGRQAKEEGFKSVDLAMSVVKLLGATWMIALHTYLKDNY